MSAALELAGLDEAAAAFAALGRAERASYLALIAEALEAERNALVALAVDETHLAPERLDNELTRTIGQLELYGAVVAEGSYLEPEVDHAGWAGRLPHPDIRQTRRPIGPVAVYAAGNFPFAFGVAGTDSASALAAGCPVVVKAHPDQPELSRRLAAIVRAALEAAGAHPMTFVLVEGLETGRQLVTHPSIAAAAFTGSTTGGRALFDLANARPDPIPFYGEMGSINPVFIWKSAIELDPDGLAQGLAASLTASAGQLCTKPGLIFYPRGTDFADRVVALVDSAPRLEMLSGGIRTRLLSALDQVRAIAGVREASAESAGGTILLAPIEIFLGEGGASLLTECFGPAAVLIDYETPVQLRSAALKVEGTLTATIHSADESDDGVREVLAAVERRAGRILYNGWPTGLSVSWATHHGGPYPATTAPLATSVGPKAIGRFLRPVAYQGVPDYLLPDELREQPVHELVRRVDGRFDDTSNEGAS